MHVLAEQMQVAGRQALQELRQLVGLLRENDDDEPAPLTPQPTLADLPAMVEESRLAGMDVTLQSTGQIRIMTEMVERTAYRIVQESLTNAGPDYGSDLAGWPAGFLLAGTGVAIPLLDLRDAGSGIDLPRARVIGGSSAVNACYWVRGSALDFDRWRDLGNPGWGFDDLLPYFRRAETDPLGGPLHGTDGPVTVWRVQDWSAGDLAVMEAAVALGLERVDDINGAREQVPSVGPVPKNLVGYDRLNAALSYLRPVRHRPNLRVLAETTVDRVRFEGTRAAGVVTTTGERIDADLVVLAAGAYFTPGILNRSGYGDSSELERLGIRWHSISRGWARTSWTIRSPSASSTAGSSATRSSARSCRVRRWCAAGRRVRSRSTATSTTPSTSTRRSASGSSRWPSRW